MYYIYIYLRAAAPAADPGNRTVACVELPKWFESLNQQHTVGFCLTYDPSQFLDKFLLSTSCSCCLVAPSCKHQASRTDPSPQQNST